MADAAPAPLSTHVDREVGDVVVRRPRVERVQAAPAHDAAVHLADEHRVARSARGEPAPSLLGRARLGLERRQAVLDALVVDRGDRLGVDRLGGTDSQVGHASSVAPGLWIHKMNCMNRNDSRYLTRELAMTDLDLNPVHVRTLQAIARSGSFSRAGETLHLSQPAISHHVRHLERAVGLPLLIRRGRRASPTEAGAVLLEHAGRAFKVLDEAREAIQRLRGRVAGRVSVWTGATASIYLLPPLLRRLRARYPDLDLVVVTGNAGEIAAAVSRGELDLGIVTLPVPAGRGLAISPFYVDQLVAIAPPGRPWR